MENRLANRSVGRLFSGIVSDAEDLVQLQFSLFKAELKDELRAAKQATFASAIGGAILVLALFMLCFTAVHLLDYLTEELPLWACYAIVAGVLAVAGGIALAVGLQRFRELTPVADETVEELKENVRWLTKPN
jgi:protein-S-isoprenylcysteine O-methyltransferase Ste14